MSLKVETYGSIRGGALHISFRDRFMAAFGSWADCRVRITVERIYRKRSLYQNAYHFGVVVHEFIQGARDEWGEDLTTDQAHEMLKLHCNHKEVLNTRTGELVKLPQSTKSMTTVQFMEFNDRCVKLIAEYFGRAVPAPNEQGELNFN